jgi:TolA-binding protein
LWLVIAVLPSMAFAQGDTSESTSGNTADAEEPAPVAPKPSATSPSPDDLCGDDTDDGDGDIDPAAREAVKTSSEAAVVVSDGSATADEVELDNWRAAAARFQERAEEFTSEVSRMIYNRYDREVAELRGGYERLVGHADLKERMLREEAIRAHERFVKDHPNSVHTPRRMFRLAELYFEDSDEKYLNDDEKYREIDALFELGKIDFLPEPPLKDYRRSIKLYKQIIERFPEYEDRGAVYYMLGFCYSDETARHLDSEFAKKTYEALVANVPDSIYANQALFRLGNIAFEKTEDKRVPGEQHPLEAAIGHYKQVIDHFDRRAVDEPSRNWSRRDQRLFEGALYKYAWAYYKLDRPLYDDLEFAITKFVSLLDWGEGLIAENQSADLRPETIRYVAISFADLSSEFGVDPMRYAVQWLDRLGAKPWQFDVLKELAEVLVEQARFEESIDAYALLQERFPLRPEAPEFQNRIVEIWQNMPVPDSRASSDARVQLAESYGPKSKWNKANRDNPEALSKANDYIFQSLEFVAISYHTQAIATNDPNDFLLAAERYREYLDTYPFAQNAYDLNFWLAECLFYGRRWDEAITQYRSLAGFPENSKQREALESIMAAYRELWLEQPEVADLPGALANMKPKLGETVDYAKIPLTNLDKDYVGAARDLLEFDPNYSQAVVLLYDIGQIYYFRNWLPQAREIFQRLIGDHPDTKFASFSAGNVVDSYLYTGQLGRMRLAAKKYAAMGLGGGDDLALEREQVFKSLERQALFKQGEIAYGSEKYDCAVDAFEEYYSVYGHEGTDEEPQNIDLVLYNIAQALTKLGQPEASNEYFERLLADFPHSEQAPATFWKMASNYERVLKLEKAVRYYEDLVQYHPDHKDTASALYNAAFLKVGLKRFGDAARDYERYHSMFPEDKAAKGVLYRAAQMYETMEDSRNAKRVYTEWLGLYGADDADRWVETNFKLAGFAEAAGRRRDAAKLLALIDESYPTMKSELGGLGVKIAAEIHFQPLREDYEAFAAYVFTGDIKKDAKVIGEKIEWNARLKVAFDTFVVEYSNFEWQSAAIFYKGLSFQTHADQWSSYPIPKDIEDDFELLEIFMGQIDKRTKPMYDAATAAFTAVVDAARTKKRHTTWVERALFELNRIDPNLYQVLKPEKSTVIESDALDLPPPVEGVPEAALAPAERVHQLAQAESP